MRQPSLNHQQSPRGSRAERETAQRRPAEFNEAQCDEIEHIAGELTLIAIALRERVNTVTRVDQWCLALSSMRLAHRLAIGALAPCCMEGDHAVPGPACGECAAS